jgi:hypothetical protein
MFIGRHNTRYSADPVDLSKQSNLIDAPERMSIDADLAATTADTCAPSAD